MKLNRDLFPDYDTLIFFDTETTGFTPTSHWSAEQNKDVIDRVVELGAVKFARNDAGDWEMADEQSDLISLPEGEIMPEGASKVNHITGDMISKDGLDPEEAFSHFSQMISGKTLLIAYNAHFDVNFLKHELKNRCSFGNADLLSCDVYDAMLTARARIVGERGFNPGHRLGEMLSHYDIQGVENSHRALDDVYALSQLVKTFHEERPDLDSQINVFPYYRRHGMPSDRLDDPKFKFIDEYQMADMYKPTRVVPISEILQEIIPSPEEFDDTALKGYEEGGVHLYKEKSSGTYFMTDKNDPSFYTRIGKKIEDVVSRLTPLASSVASVGTSQEPAVAPDVTESVFPGTDNFGGSNGGANSSHLM